MQLSFVESLRRGGSAARIRKQIPQAESAFAGLKKTSGGLRDDSNYEMKAAP
jgi:hypothetical protein